MAGRESFPLVLMVDGCMDSTEVAQDRLGEYVVDMSVLD